MGALDWIFLIVSVLLIIVTLIQGGKSEGASGAITGGGMNVFAKTKERGVDRVLSIVTFILVAVFFLLAILVKVL
ncbi:MAG: preprotein translocase subunit SecG [Erysipelotrichaceae bacterium]|nr:preprotein translocase subunit SecG [Erysipelotrichaceae bacterium]